METADPEIMKVVFNQNRLFERIRALYGDELRARYAELRNGVLSVENIKAAFNEFVGSIPENSYAMDHAMWNGDGHLVRTLDLMWEMMDQYLPQVDAEFGYGIAEAPAEEAGDLPEDVPADNEVA